MKNLIFTIVLLALHLLLISSASILHHVDTSRTTTANIMGCAPGTADFAADEQGKFMYALNGLGRHRYKISTTSDSAQLYFNQGVNFYFSYHFREALASFKEAERFDANSAMVYWGQALSMGPYYNDYVYKMRKEVPGVVKAMKNLETAASSREKSLIHAMETRYSEDLSNSDRKQLDSNYAASLRGLVVQYKDDNDIAALFIDAMMLQHKWDFWNNNGTPKPWTPELVKLCETILKSDPNHPAALHYYIHLTEASKHPELALHSADVLKDEMTGAGHMVHMATHMYQRNGLYAKGVDVNEQANNVNNNVDSLVPALGLGKNSVPHIYAVQSFCAINAGMYKKGIPIFMRARNRVSELIPSLETNLYPQYIYMMPVLARVRFGKWSEILNEPAVNTNLKYASVLDNYARGFAYLNAKKIKEAKKCLGNIEKNLSDSSLAIRIMPFNSPLKSCEIAASLLKGAILFDEGKKDEAIASLQQAVATEDKLVYREPQDWMIPTRQYLGAYLLKMKKPVEAEAAYKEDLLANPENGWALIGIYNSLKAQNKKSEAAGFKARYSKAFQYGDVKPVASVF